MPTVFSTWRTATYPTTLLKNEPTDIPMKIIPFILLLILVVGCKNNKQPSSQTEPLPTITSVRGIGKIIPEQEIIRLAMPASGNVAAILVKENDSVSAGTPLIQLASPQESAELALAEATADAQRALVAAQQSAVNEAEVRLKNMQTEYDRIDRLYRDGAETGQVYDNASTDLKVQQAVVEKSRRQLQSEQSKLTESLRNIAVQKSIMEKRVLRAPANGTVLEISVHPGEYVQEGSEIGQFRPNGATIALCEVDELFASKVHVGERAYLLSVGGVDTLGVGKVIFCSKYLKNKSLFYEQAGEAEDRRVLEVKILPDKPLPLLLNSKIECSIQP